MAEAAAALLALGQQLVQQQQPGGENPTVCFAAVPLLIPAVAVMANSLLRRLGSRPD